MSLSIIVAGIGRSRRRVSKASERTTRSGFSRKESHNAERRGSLTCCRTSSIPGIQIPAKVEPNGGSGSVQVVRQFPSCRQSIHDSKSRVIFERQASQEYELYSRGLTADSTQCVFLAPSLNMEGASGVRATPALGKRAFQIQACRRLPARQPCPQSDCSGWVRRGYLHLHRTRGGF